MQLLRETLGSNPTALLHCIQYEVLDKRPVFDSYRSFCRKMGPDVMDFVNFEFWYMRFYRDQLDLEYIRDTKPLELLDLPVELVDKVIQELDPVDRIVTRQVCKTLQYIVDHQSCSFEKLDFHITSKGASLGFDGKQIHYKNNGNGCKVIIKRTVFVVENKNCVKTALKDFNFILTSQKRKLKKFHLSTFGMSQEDLKVCTSEFLNAKPIHVESLNIGMSSDFESIVSIWTLLAPGVLEEIVFDCGMFRYIHNEIAETEQWKQARLVDLTRCGDMSAHELSKCYGFSDFQIRLLQLTIEDVVQLSVNLRQSAHFERCEISASLEFDQRQLANALGTVVQNDGDVHDPIPDSPDYLQYIVLFSSVLIVKKHA